MFRVVLSVCLFLGFAFAQQKVAILGTEDDGDPPLKHTELSTLTAKLRYIATETLPRANYEIMTEQSIVSFLGSQDEVEKVCKAADGCLAKIGRDIEADYIGQARISRFGKFLSVKVEVYDVKKGTLVSSFTDESSKDIYALLATIEKKSPDMFKKIFAMTPTSTPVAQEEQVKTSDLKALEQLIISKLTNQQATPSTPAVSTTQNSYLVNISTSPQGAKIFLNSEYECTSPCRDIEIIGGKIRILAESSKYEAKDTIVNIIQDNQLITLNLIQNAFSTTIITEPKGAELSFNGEYINSCRNSPCKVDLKKGEYNVTAKMKLYEKAETDVSITEDNKEIRLELKPNYGVLNISPAYSDNIGEEEDWKLTLNNEPFHLGTNKFLPGEYDLKLSHKCYEDINIASVGVTKNKTTNVDVSDKLKLKQSSLHLEAKYKGRLISEPVFVNGWRVGETTLDGTVPLCSEIITIGEQRERIDVDLSSGAAQYFYEKKPTILNTLLVTGLGLAGAGLAYKAYDENKKVGDYYAKYSNLLYGSPSEFDRAWKKIEDTKTKSMIFLISGGVSFISAIGVYLWF